jgi:nucleoside-diphosphate-sugar epimerase
MARVLLTGASGFVGREVATQLVAAGHEVHALGRRAPTVSGVVHHAVDLLAGAPELRQVGATHLIHAAWYAEPGKFWNAPENCDWVAASLRLARTFADAGGHRMVVAGSCAEYGWDRPVFSEETLGPPPQTLYGQAKRSLFELMTAAAPLLGLSLAWGRIFIPYGAHEDARRLLGTLIAARAEGRPAEFSTGEQIRDFIHVADVGAALVRLIESGVAGPVNIGSGVGTSVQAFVEEAATIAGYAHRIKLGARPMRADDPASLVADVTRLTDLIGFRPRHTLSSGLAEALGHDG